jgi:uncharacterized repeat protein (TIGR03803 family)
MTRSREHRILIFATSLLASALAQALAILFVLAIAATPLVQAQTFTVIHSFGGPDGANPGTGLTLDRAGNLYGTTEYGGNTGGFCQNTGCGTIFKLSHAGSGWVLSTLLKFNGQNGGDGLVPLGRVIFGPDGTLYGTTSCCSGGTVFNLRPPANRCSSVSCPWTETVLYRFGYANGAIPIGDLAFDAGGNIYGTTRSGGDYNGCFGLGCGEVYQLTPSSGGWTQQILHNFEDGPDGEYPNSGVILDQAGNVYGTAPQDGSNNAGGVVFELTPSGPGWNFGVIYHFQNGADGDHPWGGLIFDSAGNLYSTTTYGGSGNGGTVFELMPSGGNWNFNLLYGLPGDSGSHGSEAKLARDSAGNLYGTTVKDGAYGHGSVFKLTPSNGGWTYTSLHDFTGGSDGGTPYGSVVLDSMGNLYGTTQNGGNAGPNCGGNYCGVVFEISSNQ